MIRVIDQRFQIRRIWQVGSTENVERHLGDTGLESEYASHYRIGALSGGQKVKVVLAAAMGPFHILILDEPPLG